jgi:hypothetical protein
MTANDNRQSIWRKEFRLPISRWQLYLVAIALGAFIAWLVAVL